MATGDVSAMIQLWTDRMMSVSPDWCWPKWCLTIYEKDYIDYPVAPDRNTMALQQTSQNDDSYLRYFKASRGYSRPLGHYPRVWELMLSTDLVLYYPQYFHHLISQTQPGYPEDLELLRQLETMAVTPTRRWAHVSNSSTSGSGVSTNTVSVSSSAN